MTSHNAFPTIQSSILRSLVAVTRSANQLGAEDLAFHRQLNEKIGQSVDKQADRLLNLAQRLINSATSDQDSLAGVQLENVESVDNNWREVVDVLDSLLERADTTLDEFGGYVKRNHVNDTTVAATATVASPSSWRTQKTHNEIVKPQKSFDHPPDNFARPPWRPLLTSKPHAKTPYEQSLQPAQEDDGRHRYPHPYEKEIKEYKYPASVYSPTEPTPYRPFESTTATLVDTPEKLDEMLAELKQASEIAVDLEHHDMRTYIGLVSLMQISTRDSDWIVDTLKPWRRKLECLNEVFADPGIIKVFHGSFMDVIWLQRDLGLYLVGLFDTHHACRALRYPGGSLAFLLQKFVNFVAQKQYQMADWRQRPLPEELFDYARADTHFLLYVYDCLRNDLAELSEAQGENLVNVVLEQSKETALSRYENPVYDFALGQGTNGWYKQLWKTPAMLSKEQFAVFRAVHQWRDKIAREEDESVFYVMKNHNLLEIARSLPSNKASLLALIQQPSSIVRQRLDEILNLVSTIKATSEHAPELNDVMAKADEAYEQVQIAKKSNRWMSQVAQATKQAATNDPATQSIPSLEHESSNVGAAKVHSAESSNFWGKIKNIFTVQKKDYSTAVRLSLPMPELSEPLEAALEAPLPASPEPEPVETDMQTKAQDDVFVARQLGGPNRKRDATTAGLSDTAGQTGSAEDDGGQVLENEEAIDAIKLREKAERKAQKKLAKQLKKQQEAQAMTRNGAGAGQPMEIDTNDNDNDDNDDTPFDYAGAPSVLYPVDENGRPKGNPKANPRKAKPMNPYARAMDAPKGLGRVQKPGAGRSGTWTN